MISGFLEIIWMEKKLFKFYFGKNKGKLRIIAILENMKSGFLEII